MFEVIRFERWPAIFQQLYYRKHLEGVFRRSQDFIDLKKTFAIFTFYNYTYNLNSFTIS